MFDEMELNDFISNLLALTFQFLGKKVTYGDIQQHAIFTQGREINRIWNKSELAQHLFLSASYRSALNQFNRYLRRHPDLLAALHAAGWHDTDRLFYPHQVKVVFDYVNAARRDR